MIKCPYCNKEFTSKQQLGGHIIWCKSNPNRSGKSNLDKVKKNSHGLFILNELQDDLFCRYCGKQCKNLNALKQHECRCNKNPNKIVSCALMTHNKSIQEGKITVWNKGLTKDTHLSIKQQSETYSQHVKDGIITSSGGYRENTVKGCYKYGKYQNIRCDSSWELAFLVYHLEHNISIARNTERFSYVHNGKEHKFVPDFIVNNNELVEIKGLQDIAWKSKQAAYPDIKFVFKKDIKPYLEYVIQKYGKEFWNVLYD